MSETKNIYYKCRAECEADVKKVRDHWKKNNINLKNDKVEEAFLELGEGNRIRIPDVDWTFTTEATADSAYRFADDQPTPERLIQLAKEIDDAHVLWETLKPLELYTGKRRWREEADGDRLCESGCATTDTKLRCVEYGPTGDHWIYQCKECDEEDERILKEIEKE